MTRKGYAPPRMVLKENLAELLRKKGWSGPELAAKAKVDRKSVNNMLNGRYDSRPEKIEAVANALGLAAWMLLRPGTAKNYADETAEQLETLLDKYTEATAEERATIMRVAEMAGTYKAR